MEDNDDGKRAGDELDTDNFDQEVEIISAHASNTTPSKRKASTSEGRRYARFQLLAFNWKKLKQWHLSSCPGAIHPLVDTAD